MSFFKNLFDGRVRRARGLEAQGKHREAAALYAEASEPLEALRCLVEVGERTSDVDGKVAAWLDALALAPAMAVDERRAIELRIGRARLEEARAGRAGLVVAATREALLDAARRLEQAGAFVDAADAFELLEQSSDVARCLELGGEVERLEELLSRRNAREAKDAAIRRLVSEGELAESLGDRRTARRVFREAASLEPGDAGLRALARRVEERWLPATSLVLTVAGTKVGVVGRLPAVIGRSDAELVVRGASVSRAHARIATRDGALVLEDLGSRNGTLVHGMPIGAPIVLRDEAPLEVGLGDDVLLRVERTLGACSVEVVRGLDKGMRFVVGEGSLGVPGALATLRFEDDAVLLSPLPGERLSLQPDGAPRARTVAGEVVLARGDVVEIEGVRIEAPR